MVRLMTTAAAVTLSIFSGVQAASTPTTAEASSADQVTPKVVLQSIRDTGFDVATWSADSRFVFTASGSTSELLVWDVARRVIVDRVKIPLPEGAVTVPLEDGRGADASLSALFYGMRLSSDGRALELVGETLEPHTPEGRKAHGWRVDLDTRHVALVATQSAPPLPSAADPAVWWSRRAVALRNAHLSAMLAGVPGGSPASDPIAEAMVPPLPASPDGRWQMLRSYPAFSLRSKDGALWSMLDIPLVNRVYAAAMSEDGERLAMLTGDIGYFSEQELDSIVRGQGAPGRSQDERSVLEVFDLRSSRFTLRSRLKGEHQGVSWAADGSVTLHTRLAGGRHRAFRVDPATGAVRRAGNAEGPGNATRAGVMPDRPVGWSVSEDGLLRLWDTGSGATLLEVTFINGQSFIAVGADGRYDTDLGADAKAFRWLVPDAPFQSLASQTFMRGYYEPRLIAKRLDCLQAGDCATRLPPVASIAGLDRLLPIVRIERISPIDGRPGWVRVVVLAEDGVDPSGGRRSGVFGLRLSVADREVARAPNRGQDPARADLADWREAHRSTPGADGRYRFEFEVPVASDPRVKVFKAYAFNGDRVKSDTAEKVWTPPRWPPRPRRAFILAVGVDDYDEPRLKLNFAVSDATLIGQRLAQPAFARCPPFEACTSGAYAPRRAVLTTARHPDGRVRRVTRDDVLDALSLLGAAQRPDARRRLEAAGHDVSALDEATPDDVVVISFSGHGHADATGRFALLPGDARWPAGKAAPDPERLLTADDLTTALRPIQAGEMAMVIDACHAGASVETPGFKPGPMGDPSLGQLAYDKGIRILAATQADDVALESGRLRQGLLTYALAGEGITTDGGKADLDDDGRVGLEEWLRYAVQRMPTLAVEARSGAGAGTVGYSGGFTFFDRAPAGIRKPQQPSLFDFTGEESPVVLRELRR